MGLDPIHEVPFLSVVNVNILGLLSILTNDGELVVMRALTWQGKRSVSVEQVPDPVIQEPTDAIIRITSTAICGSDLHLYEVRGPT